MEPVICPPRRLLVLAEPERAPAILARLREHEGLEIDVLSASREELLEDPTLDRALARAHARPYTGMVLDGEVSAHCNDISLLYALGSSAERSCCALLASLSPRLYGVERWSDVPEGFDEPAYLAGPQLQRWSSFSTSDCARFVAWTRGGDWLHAAVGAPGSDASTLAGATWSDLVTWCRHAHALRLVSRARFGVDEDVVALARQLDAWVQRQLGGVLHGGRVDPVSEGRVRLTIEREGASPFSAACDVPMEDPRRHFQFPQARMRCQPAGVELPLRLLIAGEFGLADPRPLPDRSPRAVERASFEAMRREGRGRDSTWEGLRLLLDRTDPGENIELFLLDATLEELRADGLTALRVLIAEGGAGWVPLVAAVIADYELALGDLSFLEAVAPIADAGHALFVAAASPEIFGERGWAEVAALPELDLEGPRHAALHRLQGAADAAHVALALPRVDLGSGVKVSAAFAFAACLTRSFARWRSGCHVAGAASGGSLEGVRVEAAMTPERERQLAENGFLVATDVGGHACFQVATSCHVPRDPRTASRGELLYGRLAPRLFVSRFAQGAEVIARERAPLELPDRRPTDWLESLRADTTGAPEEISGWFPLRSVYLDTYGSLQIGANLTTKGEGIWGSERLLLTSSAKRRDPYGITPYRRMRLSTDDVPLSPPLRALVITDLSAVDGGPRPGGRVPIRVGRDSLDERFQDLMRPARDLARNALSSVRRVSDLEDDSIADLFPETRALLDDRRSLLAVRSALAGLPRFASMLGRGAEVDALVAEAGFAEGSDVLRIGLERVLSVGPAHDRRAVEAMIEELDVKLRASVRELTSDERFLRLRSTWRGIDRLVQRAGDDVQIELLHTTRAELLEELEDAPAARYTEIYRLLSLELASRDGMPYSMLVSDLPRLPDEPGEARLLDYLGSIAGQLGAVLVSGETTEAAFALASHRIDRHLAWRSLGSPLDDDAVSARAALLASTLWRRSGQDPARAAALMSAYVAPVDDPSAEMIRLRPFRELDVSFEIDDAVRLQVRGHGGKRRTFELRLPKH